jgi:hypothetical protein
LSLENNFGKSFTVSKLAVLCNMFNSSSSVSTSSNEALIASPSSTFTKFVLNVAQNPTNTEIIDITKNTATIIPIIFPILFGLLIFVIAVVMFKKISGTMMTNSRFKNMSPSGLSTVAFSWNISPIIVPTIIATIRIIVDL